jgi:hypothetical protein
VWSPELAARAAVTRFISPGLLVESHWFSAENFLIQPSKFTWLSTTTGHQTW